MIDSCINNSTADIWWSQGSIKLWVSSQRKVSIFFGSLRGIKNFRDQKYSFLTFRDYRDSRDYMRLYASMFSGIQAYSCLYKGIFSYICLLPMNMEIWKYDEPTYKLTWVGAREACAKHIQKSAVYLFCHLWSNCLIWPFGCFFSGK